jgi:putative transposase
MPDHVHAIVWLAEAGQLSELMKQWKRMSSYHIRRYFVSSFPAYASRMEVNSVWQARYYAFSLYSHRMLEQKLNYMHQNPVRAGLVEQAVDWRWSSARYYSRGASAEIPVGWLED